jgi:hypothetical protein
MSLPPREPPQLGNRPGQQNNDDNNNWNQQQQNWNPPPPNWNNYPQQQQQPPSPPPGTGQLPPRPGGSLPGTGNLGGTDPFEPSKPGRLDNQRSGGFGSAFGERQIEYIAWGSVVILLGCSIILVTLDTSLATLFLTVFTPLIGGGILLASGFVQRLFFGYDVSLFTWGVSIASIAFGCTRAIAEITDTTSALTQLLYFIGLLVIISGLVIILQVFRPSHD